MLKIERYVTMTNEQMDIVIEGMRNPMNSWDLSDTDVNEDHILGDKDFDLAMRLAKGGPVHAKYRRMMPVWVTITAPLYWWKEFDTYKVGTVCNSCSTMHKIHEKEFTLEDFSYEHLIGGNVTEEELDDIFDREEMYLDNHYDEYLAPIDILYQTIKLMNFYRGKYLETKTKPMKSEEARKKLMKRYWWQMIQLLPSSYNQRRTIFLPYEVLANIRTWRRDHKLDEWHTFCDWLETLPYSETIG